jgi:beta-D-xylosidase 4
MRPSSPLKLALASALSTNGVIGFQYPDCVNGPLANNTVCDAKASPPDRAAALVEALNIAEKLENLIEYVLHRQSHHNHSI